MANDHITALIDRINREPDLQSRFRAVASAEEASAIAAELGFEVPTDQILEFVSDIELDDDQLEAVAGGIAPGDGDGEFLAKLGEGVIKSVKNWG
jgi:predicted ribosomally synthesized peptide with nif11-like leader